jgi:hypothetical protein
LEKSHLRVKHKAPPMRITGSSSRNAFSFFICSHNETLSVFAMRVGNPDRKTRFLAHTRYYTLNWR